MPSEEKALFTSIRWVSRRTGIFIALETKIVLVISKKRDLLLNTIAIK
ncbi:hypothetical protein HZQ11_00940 [Elizabethkingia anophelis]|nr:hypothetical protein [Elizabethkingia anophelis]MCT3650246.1 hypothetical protein [Elizabethkingia anophelis]MCT3653863.1 hypothetical protein [Elizabethkingia anophelis]MCT3657756.1 hypothetical protein [Elizabethkingia anophelis]MCT3664970.1 hypothetical protein [Elizabethkingia anophelis]